MEYEYERKKIWNKKYFDMREEMLKKYRPCVERKQVKQMSIFDIKE